MIRSTLLLFLLTSYLSQAQEVKPILSDDYTRLIKNDSARRELFLDTTNSIRSSSLQVLKTFQGTGARKIKIKRGIVTVRPAAKRTITLSGNYTTSAEIKWANRQPQLQTQYVQGRPDNGALIWRGPETGELFSYGPDIGSLHFDKSSYAHDVNGRLSTTGTGEPAKVYNNTILRTGYLQTQTLSAQSKYLVGGIQRLSASVRLGQAGEQTLIQYNKNSSRNIVASITGSLKQVNITGGFSSYYTRFSNTNRTGFLNRAYQNSLLTPISFENRQGNYIATQQRSYSYVADNPFFLLQEHPTGAEQSRKLGNLAIERRWDKFKFNITQSFSLTSQNSNEGFAAGSAFFPNPTTFERTKKDRHYYANANASYDFDYFESYYFKSTIAAAYILTNDGSQIRYTPGSFYNYQRSAYNVSLNYTTRFEDNDFDASARVENKFYSSNTTSSAFFLPSANAFVRYSGLFGGYVTAKLTGTYANFNSELPIEQSFAGANLLQLTTAQAFLYLPVMEVTGFTGLKPIRHKEWTSRLELNYRSKLSLSGEVFHRRIYDDVFPVFETNELLLKNLASHRYKGMELEASYFTYTGKFTTSNTLSFLKNSDKVFNAANGYNNTPIAGFSNIHKALVEGETLGVIRGKAFLRNGEGKVMIGDDGFPLTAQDLKIIGNPMPRFVMKLSNSISWKRLSLNLDCEWKNGGDTWNGTQAVLDYYGRSKTSGERRGSAKVYEGVSSSGHNNTKSVALFDPSLPVTQNAWTKYGYGGVDEAYIQKGDYLRINNIAASYRIASKKYIQNLLLTLYANNLVLWSAYKGVDPSQLLYDQVNTTGLDFFNLPSQKNIGISVTLQF